MQMQQISCQYFKQKLTGDYLGRVKADTDLQVSDTEVPGYHLRYSGKTGRKVLYLNYTLRLEGMRKERNLKLGIFPELSAADARAEAIKCRGQILGGIDPMLERQEHLRKKVRKEWLFMMLSGIFARNEEGSKDAYEYKRIHGSYGRNYHPDTVFPTASYRWNKSRNDKPVLECRQDYQRT
jgi:hypothetical protein